MLRRKYFLEEYVFQGQIFLDYSSSCTELKSSVSSEAKIYIIQKLSLYDRGARENPFFMGIVRLTVGWGQGVGSREIEPDCPLRVTRSHRYGKDICVNILAEGLGNSHALYLSFFLLTFEA